MTNKKEETKKVLKKKVEQLPLEPDKPLVDKVEAKKNRFSIQFDIEYGGDPGKEMDEENLTTPDMNLTVRQLLENHTRGFDENGNPITGVQQPLYFETYVPNMSDMTDVDEYKKSLIEHLAEVDEFIKQEQDEANNKSESKATGKSSENIEQSSDETPISE